MQYLTFIDASSCYRNLKLDEKSYLMTFTYQYFDTDTQDH